LNDFERDIKLKNLDLDMWELKEKLIQRIHELETRVYCQELALRKNGLIPPLGDEKVKRDKQETREFFDRVIKEHETKGKGMI